MVGYVKIAGRYSCAHIYYGIWLFGPPWGPEGGENIGKSFYLNLPDIGFTLITPIKGRIGSLTVYIYNLRKFEPDNKFSDDGE
jgi:hypothetical protein